MMGDQIDSITSLVLYFSLLTTCISLTHIHQISHSRDSTTRLVLICPREAHKETREQSFSKMTCILRTAQTHSIRAPDLLTGCHPTSQPMRGPGMHASAFM